MKVNRRKNLIKILLPIVIIISLVVTGIYSYTLADAGQNIKLTIVKRPNIDVILSKGKTRS